MRKLAFITLLLLCGPVAAADFQTDCAANVLKTLGQGNEAAMEELRPMVTDRCECIERKGGKKGRESLQFLWEIAALDDDKLKEMDGPDFRAKMMKAERKLARIGKSCDTED